MPCYLISIEHTETRRYTKVYTAASAVAAEEQAQDDVDQSRVVPDGWTLDDDGTEHDIQVLDDNTTEVA